MKPGVGIVLAAAVLAVALAAAGSFLFSGGGEAPAPQLPPEASSEPLDTAELDAMRSQLQGALESGGISPETYGEVERKIALFEEQGHENSRTQELRDLLSRLSVGGQDAPAPVEDPAEPEEASNPGVVTWQYRDGEWKPTGNPPACPDPLVLQAPVDLGVVSAILYPGQVRGGDFKPHGGFRTDGAAGPVEVRAPIDGYVVDVAKFKDSFGDHYMLDVQHPCGIMYRLGHLNAVPPEIEPIFDGFPEREFGDSRTESVEPTFIVAGATIATDIQHQAGFDWGVYDLRGENGASQDAGFREAHADEPYQAYHAVCWFDYLPADQEAIVRSLPAADGKEGKNSAYC